MNREYSIYLDLVRFSAAMVVFLGHAAGPLTEALFWQLGPYLNAAVMVFFVLSGYVIAYVCDVKEQNMKTYSFSRISRLLSVVLPALILTYICDAIGLSLNRDLYMNGPWPQPEVNILNYGLSAILLQNVWGLELYPGMNTPFWSITFEFIFYGLFGLTLFCKGVKRIVLMLVCSLLAGPDILLYYPIWLLGVLVYKFVKHNTNSLQNKHARSSILLSLLALVIFIYFGPTISKQLPHFPELLITKRNILSDYFYAITFSVHLAFVLPLLAKTSNVLIFFQKPILYCAGLTFSLYLFHRPLIQVLATIHEDLGSTESRITVIGGTLLVTWIVGSWSEKQKYTIKKSLYKIFSN